MTMASTTIAISSLATAAGIACHPPPPQLPRFASFPRRSSLVIYAAASSKTAAAATAEKKQREPRGITKPRPITPQLQALLGVSEIPRTQALKQIWVYIKENNLQDPENKKIIVCDEKLKNIFGRDRVGFLEISGLLNPHFRK